MFDVPDEYDPYVHPDAGEVSKQLYHVAPRAARASIAAEGLSVDEQRTHNTGGWYGEDSDWLHEIGDDGEPYQTEWRPHGVYLFPRLDQALSYHNANPENDLYVIDSEDLDLIRDPSVAMNWEHDNSHHAYVTEYVPERSFDRVESAELTRMLAEAEAAQQVHFAPRLSSMNAPAEQLSLGEMAAPDSSSDLTR